MLREGTHTLLAQVFDGDGLIDGLEKARNELSGSGIREEEDIIIVIISIINNILPFAAIAAVIAFIVSGFMFILGFGSDTAIQRAKKIMIWSAVGLVIIILSIVFISFLLEILGDGSGSPIT